jgi:hypothetical protein
MQKEVWKDIPNYEGLYQVSNLGRVKNKLNILKNSPNSRGYCYVKLYKFGIHKMYAIHQLVALNFLGHISDGTHRIVVDHINNDKLDNRVENLQLISNRENCSKDKKNGTSKYTGVSWCKSKNKWVSRIYINKKIKHIGYFINEYDAYLSYLKEKGSN